MIRNPMVLTEHPQALNQISHRLTRADTDNRHIITVKSQGFSQTPQDIMEEYNGCSAPPVQTLPLCMLL
jgi:hypothetical protein